MTLENMFREFLRALAMDRAYQMASFYSPPGACRGCGLPSVRAFGVQFSSGWPACSRCAPPNPTKPSRIDFVVPTIAELPRHPGASGLPGLTAFVLSTERVYVLSTYYADELPDEITVAASSLTDRCWRQQYAMADEEPVDHPNRRAIERLMRIAQGEVE